jgi:hypothetical protein
MKVLALIALSILGCTIINGQITRKTILDYENIVPNQWPDSLIGKSKWILKQTATISNNKKVIEFENVDGKTGFKFFKLSVEMLPFGFILISPNMNDTISNFNISYFRNQNTFYANKTTQAKPNGTYERRFPFRVIYLNADTLILEAIDEFHFDYQTGVVMTEKEFEKRAEEYNKQNGDKLFGGKVINIGKKKSIRYWGVYTASN